jgi:RNA recognition motif-containing protein
MARSTSGTTKFLTLIGLPSRSMAQSIILHLSNLINQDLSKEISPKQIQFSECSDGLFRAVVPFHDPKVYRKFSDLKFMFIEGDGIYVRPDRSSDQSADQSIDLQPQHVFPKECTLILAGLPPTWKASRLDYLLDLDLGIAAIKIAYSKYTGKSRGFAFIGFASPEQAQAVLSTPSPYKISVFFGSKQDHAVFVPLATPLCGVCRKPHDLATCPIKQHLDSKLIASGRFLGSNLSR